jgi:hypothetical protein
VQAGRAGQAACSVQRAACSVQCSVQQLPCMARAVLVGSTGRVNQLSHARCCGAAVLRCCSAPALAHSSPMVHGATHRPPGGCLSGSQEHTPGGSYLSSSLSARHPLHHPPSERRPRRSPCAGNCCCSARARPPLLPRSVRCTPPPASPSLRCAAALAASPPGFARARACACACASIAAFARLRALCDSATLRLAHTATRPPLPEPAHRVAWPT